MTEAVVQSEIPMPEFKTMPTTLSMPARCVDGRPDFSRTNQGTQLPGGSIFPIVLNSLEHQKAITQETVNSSLSTLKSEPNNFGIGDHRDNHHHEGGACGCGFADRLPDIIKKAQDQRAEITKRLSDLGINGIEESYDVIKKYPLDHIQAKGEQLVSPIEANGGVIEMLDGEHNEQIAFVNLEENTTLDTNGLNKNGQQAFNLDLWAAVKQAQALGASEKFARGASLILYMATEMVLVEDKGKKPLQVLIHT